jgi:hypothetical protein
MDNSFERFVLNPPEHKEVSQAEQPSLARADAGFLSKRSILQSSLVSTVVTLEALLHGLRSAFARHLAAANPKPLGLIVVDGGGIFLVPLHFGPADIRVLVIEHSSQALAHGVSHVGASEVQTDIHLRASQIHVLSLAKWPHEPASRERKRMEKQEASTTTAATGQRHSKTRHKMMTALGGQLGGGGLEGFAKATSLSANVREKQAEETKQHAAVPSIPADAPFFFLAAHLGSRGVPRRSFDLVDTAISSYRTICHCSCC